MNPHDNAKLNQRAREEFATQRVQAQSNAAEQAALEFKSPEDMLRHDAARTGVPGRVAERLQDSIRREPPRPKGWLSRLFGRR